jgi:hypothetical protein
MKTKTTQSTRHHCYDENNVKIIKLQSGDIPLDQLSGHTPWMRGTGPHSAQSRENIKNALRNTLKGVPKTAEQKRKMSIAKLGKPKSAEHRANMSAAHQKRLARIRNEKSKALQNT